VISVSVDLAISIHALVMVGEGSFKLVLRLLIVGPIRLSSLLLESEPLVLLHHGLHHGVLLLGGLILEHPTHAGDSFGLHGVLVLIFLLLRPCGIHLTFLLVGPVPLVLSVTLHSVVVNYKDTFELETG